VIDDRESAASGEAAPGSAKRTRTSGSLIEPADTVDGLRNLPAGYRIPTHPSRPVGLPRTV